MNAFLKHLKKHFLQYGFAGLLVLILVFVGYTQSDFLASLTGTTKIKVHVVKSNGASTNGVVVAKKGSVTKTCSTSGGMCTVSGLTGGNWVLTAKCGSLMGGPVTKTAKVGKTVAVYIVAKPIPEVTEKKSNSIIIPPTHQEKCNTALSEYENDIQNAIHKFESASESCIYAVDLPDVESSYMDIPVTSRR